MKFEQYCENAGLKIDFTTPKDNSYFFGYYDQSPLSLDGTKLLAHLVNFDARDVKDGDTCQVGYFTLQDGVYHVIDIVETFNWQQGARLQWLPSNEDELIYNSSINGRFVSIIYNIVTGNRRQYDMPIYSVHPTGKFALTIDFAHLRYCRYGYGYCGGDYPNASDPIPEGDGVFKLDFASGVITTFIETQTLVLYRKHEMDSQYHHWIEHMTWNRSGSRVTLYFRYGDASSIGMYTQLFTIDSNGKDIYEFHKNMDYSHIGWNSDDEFVVFSRPYSKTRVAYGHATKEHKLTFNAFVFGILRPIYHFWKKNLSTEYQRQKISNGDMGYYIFRDRKSDAAPLLVGTLVNDGHPSYHPFLRNIILTDTYADFDGFRHLLIINKDSNKTLEIGKFYSDNLINDHRCDLHPRWDYTGTKVIIDTPHDNGGRCIIVLDVISAIKLIE